MTSRPTERLWTRWIIPSGVGALVVGLCAWAFIHFGELNPFASMERSAESAACPQGKYTYEPAPSHSEGKVRVGKASYMELTYPWGLPAAREGHRLSPGNMGQFVSENVDKTQTPVAEVRLFQLLTGDHGEVTLPGLTNNTFRCIASTVVASGGKVDKSSTKPTKVSGKDAMRLEATMTTVDDKGQSEKITYSLVVVDDGGTYFAMHGWASEKHLDLIPGIETTLTTFAVG